MPEDTLNFEEFKRKRDADTESVRCAHCGKWIPAIASRCPECHVHFQGEAYAFAPPTNSGPSYARLRSALILIAVLSLIVLVFVGLLAH